MIVNFGGIGLLGTIGCATVQIDNRCRCVGFVRSPAQLGTGTSASDDSKSSCTTGEVTFTTVRAPCAQRKSSGGSFGAEGGGGDYQAASISTPNSGVVNSEPIVAMVQRAVERSVIFEQLPLARFELVVNILSSTDDESDIQGIAAAACAALIDSTIALRDVFGAATSSVGTSSSSGNSSGNVRTIVAAHTGGVLGMQSSAASCTPEELCRAVEACAKKAAQQTLSAFGVAAERFNQRNGQQQQQQQQQQPH